MSTPAACASASMISTPGMTGRAGKWPWKYGSLAETFFSATMRLLGLAARARGRSSGTGSGAAGASGSSKMSISVSFFFSCRFERRARARRVASRCRTCAAYARPRALSSTGTGRCTCPACGSSERSCVQRRDLHMVGDLEMAERSCAAPPIVQWRPMWVLPATPVQPAIAVCAPMRSCAPTWIWLSSFTPSSINGVVERAAVDGGVGADLDVVADAHARRSAGS